LDPTLASDTVTEPVAPVTATVASTEGRDSPFAVTQVILKAPVDVGSDPPDAEADKFAPALNAVPVVPGGSTPQSVLRTRCPDETGEATRTLSGIVGMVIYLNESEIGEEKRRAALHRSDKN
jgi:hypothetical protein